MLIIFFNPHMFSIMNIFQQDEHFTVQYFIDFAIMRLAQVYYTKSRDIARRRLHMHSDNSRYHTTRAI
jgi:hypothetical protein